MSPFARNDIKRLEVVKRFLPYLRDVRGRAAFAGALMVLSPLVAIVFTLADEGPHR